MNLLKKISSATKKEPMVEISMEEMIPADGMVSDMEMGREVSDLEALSNIEDMDEIEYDDDDIEAVLSMGPLGSISEYLEPLVVQATPQEFEAFIMAQFKARQDMLYS